MKIFLVFVLIFLADAKKRKVKVDPIKYLEKYGYLPEGQEKTREMAEVSDAIKNFQRFTHLPVTGKIDTKTEEMMKKPRCGMKDEMPHSFEGEVRKKRYIPSTAVWDTRNLTYTFINFDDGLGEDATRDIIARALALWSAATNIDFAEVSGNEARNAHIKIRFAPDDGPLNTLGYTWLPHAPTRGQIFFDEDEDFTDGVADGINLYWVAVHEFGHTIGLPHTDIEEAIMFPFYTGFVPDLSLRADDAGAIQALYGCRDANPQALEIPQDGAPYNGVMVEKWRDVEGENMHHIEPSVCSFPHQPTTVSVLQSFDAPANSGDNFATRLKGYFKPKKNGVYRFYVCGDSAVKFFVSGSRNPADKKLLQHLTSPTSQDLSTCPNSEFQGAMSTQQDYYIEAIHKEGSGDDFIKVGFKAPGESEATLITAQDIKWALPDVELRVIVCKGRYENLYCPQSHTLEIVTALYGMYRNRPALYNKVKDLCNLDAGLQDRSIANPRANCDAPTAQQVVQDLCDGNQQCTIYAHDSVFADNCGSGVYSVLDVTYKCNPQGIGKRRKKKHRKHKMRVSRN